LERLTTDAENLKKENSILNLEIAGLQRDIKYAQENNYEAKQKKQEIQILT